jgi:hypothetical protein
MKRYKNEFEQFNDSVSDLFSLITRLTLNIKTDREGMFTDRTQFSERLYELSGSIQYRLSSVNWHLKNLCTHHVSSENKLAKEGVGSQETTYLTHYMYYLFDDFIFNLISLYDYFGSYFNLAFINSNKPGLMWGRMAKAARDPNNDFSQCVLAKNIKIHNSKWVQNLENVRAEIIHYNIKKGGDKKKMSWSVGEDIQFHLMASLPEDIVKILDLNDCKKNDLGVDLQFGAIEIGMRSIKTLCKLTDIALKQCTTDSIKFTPENKKIE